MSKRYIGIDIGGTAVKIGYVTAEGELLATDSKRVDFDHYQTPIIVTVKNAVDQFLALEHITLAELSGFGISATGQIDTKEGVVSGTAGHIANWIQTPIAQIFKDSYHLPVSVVNDADCALMGECWLGAARGYRDVVMVTIGTGIGGGILTEGRLLTGVRGIAGELGHFPIRADGELCSCGNRGCYEKYASTTALVNMVRDRADELVPDISADHIDGQLIFNRVSQGDTALRSVVSEWITSITLGLVGLIHIFNPQLVLIGGGVSQQEELFIEPLQEQILSYTMPGFCKDLIIKSAQLGNNAGLLGAVAYLKNLF